jgi:HAE1 family hydrophobic/amphiphilic exporter-1
MGIVVNDSLVLVDFINRSRRRGVARWRAVIKSGTVRLRPIVLTSITTMGGLLPMALGYGSGLEGFLAPLAIAIVGGLGFATVLTLIVIPCVYGIFDDLRGLLMGLARRWFPLRKSLEATAAYRPETDLPPEPEGVG